MEDSEQLINKIFNFVDVMLEECDKSGLIDRVLALQTEYPVSKNTEINTELYSLGVLSVIIVLTQENTLYKSYNEKINYFIKEIEVFNSFLDKKESLTSLSFITKITAIKDSDKNLYLINNEKYTILPYHELNKNSKKNKYNTLYCNDMSIDYLKQLKDVEVKNCIIILSPKDNYTDNMDTVFKSLVEVLELKSFKIKRRLQIILPMYSFVDACRFFNSEYSVNYKDKNVIFTIYNFRLLNKCMKYMNKFRLVRISKGLYQQQLYKKMCGY